MDLYLIAHIAMTVALLAAIAAALLVWVDGLRDTRARERREREALAAADEEVSRRPRVPAPFPLPNLKGTHS
jgi:hypothetical protein